jgi:hypothetical protein
VGSIYILDTCIERDSDLLLSLFCIGDVGACILIGEANFEPLGLYSASAYVSITRRRSSLSRLFASAIILSNSLSLHANSASTCDHLTAG